MISGTFIVKDRIDTIKKCIDSLSFCDEIIAVDTGSTDGTLEYLKSIDVKLYEYKWSDDFSEARNFGLDKCSGDWIFYLDSDEYLEKKYFPEIKRLTDLKADAWELIQFSETDKGDYMIVPSIRLFKKGLRFTLPVHETLVDSIKEKSYKVGKINIPFKHTGYKDKKEHYEVKEDHPLNLFYNNEGDLKKLEEMLKKNPAKNLFAYILLMLAEQYSNDGYIYKSIQLCKESLRIEPVQNLGYMLLSLIYARGGFIDEALEYLNKINTSKIVCNIFNDRFYTKETIQNSMNELLETKQTEINYIENLKG